MENPPPADGAEQLLRLVGLGMRGGMVLPGVDGTRALLDRGTCYVVVIARDASARARQKVVGMARRHDVPIVAGPPAAELGNRLGKPPVMVAGVRDRALAAGIIAVAAPGTD